MLVTAGTNGVADGEVGDEERELGKMEWGFVVMKNLEDVGKREVNREGKVKFLR